MKFKTLASILFSLISIIAYADEQILHPGQSIRLGKHDTVSCVAVASPSSDLPFCRILNVYTAYFFVYVGDALVKRIDHPFQSKANLKEAMEEVKKLQELGACQGLKTE